MNRIDFTSLDFSRAITRARCRVSKMSVETGVDWDYTVECKKDGSGRILIGPIG